MGQQSVRQAARRSALAAQLARRRARAERERRLEGLAVDVLVAVSERDAAIQAAECRVVQALLVMTHQEGLSLREVVEWCGGEITLREVARMRRLVNDPVVRIHEPRVDPSVRDKETAAPDSKSG